MPINVIIQRCKKELLSNTIASVGLVFGINEGTLHWCRGKIATDEEGLLFDMEGEGIYKMCLMSDAAARKFASYSSHAATMNLT